MPAPLELGPSTIVDEKPPLLDPVVEQLGEILAQAAQSKLLEADMELELEIRLGVLRGRRAARAELPCASEAILAAGCENFSYRFQPGLPPEIFAELMGKLGQLQLDCTAADEELLDLIYDVPPAPNQPPRQIRVSYKKEKKEQGAEGSSRWTSPVAVLKTKRQVLDLYTGRSVPTAGHSFDLRVALSTEVAMKGEIPKPNTHEIKMKREKRRRTLDFKAWQVDLTQVKNLGDDGQAVPSYEVELELKPKLLKKNLQAKVSGDSSHKLWELLTDFLDAGRDLAALASEPWPLKRPPLLKEPEPEVKANEREAYKKRLPDRPEPLIGHYLYRLSEMGWPKKRQKSTT